MTFHWKKSKACDLDEVLDDLNPQMKVLERELRVLDDGSVETEVVTTDMLVLPPITQPGGDSTNWQVYHDVASGVVELTSPGGSRGTLVFDDDGLISPPSPMAIDAESGDDGELGSLDGGVGNGTFDQARDGTGDLVANGGGSTSEPTISYAEGPPIVWTVTRSVVRFDTSSVPTAPTSGDVTYEVVGADDSGTLGPLGDFRLGLYVYHKNPPAGAMSAADWAATNASKLPASDDVFTLTQVAAAAGGTLTFDLNRFGLAHVNLDGLTAFVLRLNYDVQDVSPGWTGTDESFGAVLWSGDQAGSEPVLNLQFS